MRIKYLISIIHILGHASNDDTSVRDAIPEIELDCHPGTELSVGKRQLLNTEPQENSNPEEIQGIFFSKSKLA